MGLGGFEPPTSSLSGMRSNQLSYKPLVSHDRDVLNGPVKGKPDLKLGPQLKESPQAFHWMVTQHSGPSYPLERR